MLNQLHLAIVPVFSCIISLYFIHCARNNFLACVPSQLHHFARSLFAELLEQERLTGFGLIHCPSTAMSDSASFAIMIYILQCLRLFRYRLIIFLHPYFLSLIGLQLSLTPFIYLLGKYAYCNGMLLVWAMSGQCPFSYIEQEQSQVSSFNLGRRISRKPKPLLIALEQRQLYHNFLSRLLEWTYSFRRT